MKFRETIREIFSQKLTIEITPLRNYLSKLKQTRKPTPQVAPKNKRAHKKAERFTVATRNVLNLAQKEAERLKRGYVGPEHILVALAKEKDGSAHKILLEVGLDEDRLTALLEQFTAHYPSVETITDLSSTTKKLLKRAVDEARRQGVFFVDTHHLLLGVLQSNDTIAIEMIKSGGLDQDKLCKYIRKRVKAEPTDKLR